MSRVFLVRVEMDPVIQRLVWRPMEIWSRDGVDVVPKGAVLCDVCNEVVATSVREVEEGYPRGYAVVEAGGGEAWMLEIVCDECRRRYFARCDVYDEMPDGLGGGE